MSFSKPIDMNAVQVFVAVAEEGSMSGAATRLGISQSGVSQMVRQLEDDLGVILVNRTRRPLSLTPFGIALKNRGAILTEEIANLKAQVVEAGRGINPDLRIGLVDSFAATCGSLLIKRLLGKTSQLSIRTGLSPQQGEALLRRDLDLVVTSDPLMDANEVVRYRLFSERYLVITPRDQRHPIKTLDDLRPLANALPIVRFNRNSQVGMQVDRYLRRIDLRMPNRLELDNADALTSMVAEGIGWALTSPMCLLQAVAYADRVSIHVVEGMGLERSLYLVARRDEYTTFFEDACTIAREVIETSLLPRLRDIGSGVDKLITLNERTNHE
ncbi:DNA-binding transcriptional LysR family regulator [Cupriavidus metallidurans]|uniref:LysR family transcriptional regulator n=2 Tax=Cupriavidus TaxID=106589 RepID=A0A3G8GUN6_9BURK|nr:MULTISPECIES: LysR family transcriptional regulator [Cupriavidus]AZG11933.1 LysR family transcriptional regulator [Cupriavidus pauculus]KAB0600881.1 LysR family transcriptional regulator [Cupriavidus pauculus]MDE4922458.1 LysR family transcriptional regulator [Cupriavidus metallidurans]QBP14595.1 LysR family transcriptional regulator [Cupriavidus metallidurans]UAL02638.1 LysR family transcriptional regulator [Cupriavidus pauculus]